MRTKKASRMRTRKRVTPRRSVPVMAAAGLLAAMGTGHTETPGGQALGEILPAENRDLAECIDEARCAWVELEDYFESIVESRGRRHKLDSSEVSSGSSRVFQVRSKMSTLKSKLESELARITFENIDDSKHAAALANCIEKNICDADKRAQRLARKFEFSSSGSGESRPPKPGRAGPLEAAADRGEDLLEEALANLVKGTKTKRGARKKARKKAARKKTTKKTSKRAYRESFEGRGRRGRRASDRQDANAKSRTAPERPEGSPQAKKEKNTYLGLIAKGKVAESNGFYFETLPLELTGDILAHADIGLFSQKKKPRAAAGDGEQACLEVSTVGSAPAAAFVSMCGRQNSVRGGFEAYMLTPSGARAVTFLAGVEVAEFRATIEGGQVRFEVRDADVRGEWTLVDSVPKPADPMTISFGASLLGTGDEIGIDNLSVEAIVDDV